jgi:hypothetical protein
MLVELEIEESNPSTSMSRVADAANDAAINGVFEREWAELLRVRMSSGLSLYV